MKKITIIISFFIFTIAAKPPLEKELDCEKAYTQQDMNQCAYQEYQKTDQKLNETYQKLLELNKDNPQSKKLMIESELHWIKFKEKECEYEASFFEGGSLQPLIQATCLTHLTKERIKHLEASIEMLSII